MGENFLILYIYTHPYIYNLVHLFLAAVGLHYFAWDFSSCSQGGFSCCGAQGLDTKA